MPLDLTAGRAHQRRPATGGDMSRVGDRVIAPRWNVGWDVPHALVDSIHRHTIRPDVVLDAIRRLGRMSIPTFAEMEIVGTVPSRDGILIRFQVSAADASMNVSRVTDQALVPFAAMDRNMDADGLYVRLRANAIACLQRTTVAALDRFGHTSGRVSAESNLGPYWAEMTAAASIHRRSSVIPSYINMIPSYINITST